MYSRFKICFVKKKYCLVYLTYNTTVTNSMVKILFLSFRVTDARLKNKKSPPLGVTNSIGALLFSHIRVTNVKLINEKNSLNITV